MRWVLAVALLLAAGACGGRVACPGVPFAEASGDRRAVAWAQWECDQAELHRRLGW